MRRWLTRMLLALGVGGLISLVFLYQGVVRPHPSRVPPSYPFAELYPVGMQDQEVSLSAPSILYECDAARLAFADIQRPDVRALFEEIGGFEYLVLRNETPTHIGKWIYHTQRWTPGGGMQVPADSYYHVVAQVQQQQGATPDGRRRVDLISCFEPKSALGEAVLGLVEDSDGRPQIIPIAVRGPFFGQLAGREGQAIPAAQVLPIMRDFARAQLAERASNPANAQLRMLCALPLGAVLVAGGLVLRRILRRLLQRRP